MLPGVPSARVLEDGGRIVDADVPQGHLGADASCSRSKEGRRSRYTPDTANKRGTTGVPAISLGYMLARARGVLLVLLSPHLTG